MLVPRKLVSLPVTLVLALVSSAASAADRDPDPWFATDKAGHFTVSAGVAAGSYAAGCAIFDARGHALLAASALTIALGAAKEAADLAGFGVPSWKDLAWDGAGLLVGLVAAWSVDLIVRGVGPRHPLFEAPQPGRRASPGLVLVF